MLEIINSLLISGGSKTQVKSVDMTSIGVVTWEFTQPVTLIAGNVPQLEIDDGGGFQAATAVVQLTPTVLSASHPTGAPGIAWRILTPPTDLTFLRPFTTPVSGI
jgi:hypothetical protein